MQHISNGSFTALGGALFYIVVVEPKLAQNVSLDKMRQALLANDGFFYIYLTQKDAFKDLVNYGLNIT